MASTFARYRSVAGMESSKLKQLAVFTACDISDALLKLKVPGAGFLADLSPIRSPASSLPPLATPGNRIVAPASTVLMVSKPSALFSKTPNVSPPSNLPEPNIKPGTPYSDLTTPETIVVLSQPIGQKCAVLGGIMAARMKYLDAKGIVVDGRVRDLGALGELGIPVWAQATSIVGAAAEAKPWAHNVSITVGDVNVDPGDIIVIDPSENAIVAIPQSKIDDVLELVPRIVAADEKVIGDVEEGVEVAEAFRRHRNIP